VLWRQKGLILLITAFFAVAGVIYALTAPQQWSAKAVITAPKPEDLLPMKKISVQASALGLTGFPDGKDLYQEFVQEFNAYENRRDYLKGSPLFAEQIKESALDAKAQRRWLRDWANLATAKPVDKKGEEPGIAITFAAPAAETSLVMLEGYVGYIVKLQQQKLIERLSAQRDLQLGGMNTRQTRTAAGNHRGSVGQSCGQGRGCERTIGKDQQPGAFLHLAGIQSTGREAGLAEVSRAGALPARVAAIAGADGTLETHIFGRDKLPSVFLSGCPRRAPEPRQAQAPSDRGVGDLARRHAGGGDSAGAPCLSQAQA